MSAFGNYYKDQIVDSIKEFIEDKNRTEQIQINELVEQTLEVVNYALKQAIWQIENKDK